MEVKETKRAVIIGATSGIGCEVTKELLQQGWSVGIAGRRQAALEALQSTAPDRVKIQTLDVTHPHAVEQLQQLIDKLGGMDLFLLSSGVGYQNPKLDANIELITTHTNVEGFTRMTVAAFRYFQQQGRGHLAVISSIAGTKGIGVAPAYSATKRYQNTYMDALAQLARLKKLPIYITDIRPGFVSTDLLKDRNYPMLMNTTTVAAKIVKALNRKKRIAVIDWRYVILVFFWRMMPRWVWERLPVKN